MTTGRINQIAITEQLCRCRRCPTNSARQRQTEPLHSARRTQFFSKNTKSETDARGKSPAESGIQNPSERLLLVSMHNETPVAKPPNPPEGGQGARRQRLSAALRPKPRTTAHAATYNTQKVQKYARRKPPTHSPDQNARFTTCRLDNPFRGRSHSRHMATKPLFTIVRHRTNISKMFSPTPTGEPAPAPTGEGRTPSRPSQRSLAGKPGLNLKPHTAVKALDRH